MRHYCLQDKETQNQFNIFWDKGEHNDEDYFTKHEVINYHRHIRLSHIRNNILYSLNSLISVLRGCIDTRVGWAEVYVPHKYV